MCNELFKETNAKTRDDDITSFAELSVQLLHLYGILGSALEESYYGKYSELNGDRRALLEAEKEFSHDIGWFREKSKLYRNQLQNYKNKGLYRSEERNNLLLLYADTRKKSIESIRNLVRFLINEKDRTFFTELTNAVRQLIADTNLYIESTWTMVQSIDPELIDLDSSKNNDTRKKYELFPLNASDVTPIIDLDQAILILDNF